MEAVTISLLDEVIREMLGEATARTVELEAPMLLGVLTTPAAVEETMTLEAGLESVTGIATLLGTESVVDAAESS